LENYPSRNSPTDFAEEPYFKAGKHYNSGIVEGLNLRINLCMRKAYGYRSFELLQITLFHTLGKLPEPKFTHRFC
jgi:hypothetical protein